MTSSRDRVLPPEEIDHALSEADRYARGLMGLRNTTAYSDCLWNALYERYQRHRRVTREQANLQRWSQ